ncbi:DUF1203 domain-containing protein [Sneathiella marina]|uniref:DUF1203 domain-containing protein n=1 Tax=Sneathiella marina TaxID=2950108 RepID=A0ABY4WDL7_9PROT|nr:DUF1203 domain-containing protein [Sneathiella marina]USG62711.1 DUF1203 domain-containing protein [Sneathiella marina]
MPKLNFTPLPKDQVRLLQNGHPDADGNTPERHISDGDGNACRFCLAEIAEGDEYLIVAHRPFTTRQPYSEQGPIFLHAEECAAYEDLQTLPEMYRQRAGLLLRGYDENERIVYGTGQTVRPDQIEVAAQKILATKEVRFVHARSATNNCYQFRIEPMHEE